ncbi:MAG: endonuclease III [Gammaproteobacteria bacterium]|nr:endonuclease III [Gammaproteobacteria bacterium]
MNKKTRCQQIFQRFKAQNSQPQTELIYHSPFELLIAVMLSAQATDKRVNEVTARLYQQANTPELILALGEDTLKSLLNSVNYYVTKTKHILKTCQILIEHHHSQVPAQRAALEALPGVGRKTANVILNIIFNQPTLAVDTHIFRVAQRIGLSKGRTPLDVEQDLLKLIDPDDISHAHHWLILHGRYVCLARRPRCTDCLIRDLCLYPHKTPLTSSRA